MLTLSAPRTSWGSKGSFTMWKSSYRSSICGQGRGQRSEVRGVDAGQGQNMGRLKGLGWGPPRVRGFTGSQAGAPVRSEIPALDLWFPRARGIQASLAIVLQRRTEGRGLK